MATLTETPILALPTPSGRLTPGVEWPSFEQFRSGGASGLDAVGDGRVGTLRTKNGLFRILDERDFQTLLGLASEVDRLRDSLATIVRAARVVRENPSSASALDLLMHVASQHAAERIVLEREDWQSADASEEIQEPEEDEVILDPANLVRSKRPR
jgi:hypothetical protein